MEERLIPYQAVQMLGSGPALILAPHPDDEVFGCGGAIMRHVEVGDAIHVLILSEGAFLAEGENLATYIEMRREESRRAAKVLGYESPEFWNYPDRGLVYAEQGVCRIQEKIQTVGAKILYAPSLYEAHPDHRALAMMAIEAARRYGEDLLLALYEVGIPQQPNRLLDITSLEKRKCEAMACFPSQLEKQRYNDHILSLNRFRTYSLDPSVALAEAYYVVQAKSLQEDVLGLYCSEFQRQRKLGLAVESRRPLVSVLVRSMDRPELRTALDSIALQTYPNIEVIVVDAKGNGQHYLGEHCGPFPLRVASLKQALARSRAANLGLDRAMGVYCIFLDDDDWFDSGHIDVLVSALEARTEARIAYTGVRGVTVEGKIQEGLPVFNESFDRARLMRGNFLPIHAVLFARDLLDSDCRFDERLAVYEDWDFWLQLARHSDFIHINSISANYRAGGGSKVEALQDRVQRDRDFVAKARAKIFNKWRMQWSGEEIDALLSELDQSQLLEALNREKSHLHGEIHSRDVLLEERLARIQVLTAHLDDRANQYKGKVKEVEALQAGALQTQKEIERLQQQQVQQIQKMQVHIDSLTDTLAALKSSTSWRIMAPYRWTAIRARQWIGRIRGPKAMAETPLLLQKNPERIFSHIDLPMEGGSEVYGELTVQGWACSVAGITRITPLLDGNSQTNIEPDITREDVLAELPDCQAGTELGFSSVLDLEGLTEGQHTLWIEIEDRDHNLTTIARPFLLKAKERMYHDWYLRSLALRPSVGSGLSQQKVWIQIDLGATKGNLLEATIESVCCQEHPNWHCRIQTASERSFDIHKVLETIGYATLSDHFESGKTLAISSQDSEWLLFLQAGELLAPNALSLLLATAAEQANCDLLYSDHDRVDAKQYHFEPYFTPQWSPDFCLVRNYTGGVFLAKKTLVAGEADPIEIGLAWRYGLLLRLSEKAKAIVRVPYVLWSSRVVPSDQDWQAEMAIAKKTLHRRGSSAQLLATKLPNIRRLIWPVDHPPKVSIIIPTTGNPKLLPPCINSLLQHTDYPDYELIFLDNSRGKHPEGIAFLRDKGLQVIECNQPFNWSVLNNIGAQHATGEMLLFLNDDIEAQDPGWLRELVSHALRPDVACVGALLLYPNHTIQHAGVILVDHGGGARHLFTGQLPGQGIYQNLDTTLREVSASTGACLLVSRDIFVALSGFDEKLPIVGNDVDFCLRALDKGYRNLWTPFSCLVHHESISRKKISIYEDEERMWTRWKNRLLAGDPYYNPNLALDRSDCQLATQKPNQSLAEVLKQHQDQSAPNLRTRSRTHLYRGIMKANRRFGHYLPLSVKTKLKQWLLRSGNGRSQRTKIDCATAMGSLAGANLIGYIRAEMGVGEGLRGIARGLDAVQEPFCVLNFEEGNPSRMSDTSWRHKEVETVCYGINILHINADLVPFVYGRLPPTVFQGRYTIGYWAWELPEFPDEWLPSFEYLNEIWVPSRFVQQAVSQKAPIPVLCMPHVIQPVLDPKLDRAFFGLPKEPYLFLSMYDIYSVPYRKNPKGAIEAFKRAFKGQNKRVGLVIKVNNITESERSVLTELSQGYENIHIIDQVLSRIEINALIGGVDCFVSLHRSEGFGLGPAEAMSLGRAVLLTGWSGNVDYMTPENSAAINYQLVPLGQDYGPYKAHQFWAEPDIQDAAQWMQKLAQNTEFSSHMGERGRRTIKEGFSPPVVGKKMQQRLRYIRQHLVNSSCHSSLD